MLTSYEKKDSIIHKLNPLVKVIWIVLVIVLSFITWNLQDLIVISIISFVLILLSKLSIKIIKAAIPVMLPLLIMLIIFHGIIIPSTEQTWFSVWFINVKLAGVITALKYFFRLLGFVLCSYLLIFTTHPADLINSLLKIGVPKQIGYVILATTQFIPLMMTDAQTILQAQQARGVETKTNVINRFRAYIPMIMPLILSTVESAYERTISLELRGFFNNVKRTSFRVFKWTKKDTTILLIVSFIFIGGFLI